MARKEGSLKLSSNIEPRAAAPLDARTIVPTLADLTASGAFPYPYVGMIVSVQSEGKAYMLTALDTTSSSNWIPVGNGSESFIITATLDKDDWDSETRQQTIDFSGYDSNMIGVIGMSVDATEEEKAAYSAAAIDVVERDDTEFTFQCTRIPEIDLPVTLFIATGGAGTAIVDAVTEGDMRAATSNAVYEKTAEINGRIDELTTYSTDEVEVGTWIDGKPVYQKSFYTIASSMYTVSWTHNISNLSTIILIEGSVMDTNNTIYMLPYPDYNDLSYSICVRADPTYIYVKTYNRDMSGYSIYITIRYIKST